MPGPTRGVEDTASLKELTIAAIQDALTEIRLKRPNSPGYKELRFRTAEYFLVEAQHYIAGAWDALAVGNVRVSVAISRWILEAAMNLWWVVSDEDETERRLTELVGEALRQNANLLDGLAELRPAQADTLKQRADKDRQARSGLGCTKLDGLETRMNGIKPPDSPTGANPYVLYRICCAAAHPNLRGWEQFKRVGPTKVSTGSSDSTILTSDMATWMAATSVVYLVLCAYCLTQTDNQDSLTNWWNTKVLPLLG